MLEFIMFFIQVVGAIIAILGVLTLWIVMTVVVVDDVRIMIKQYRRSRWAEKNRSRTMERFPHNELS